VLAPITGDFTLVVEGFSGFMMPGGRTSGVRYRLDTATRRLDVEEESDTWDVQEGQWHADTQQRVVPLTEEDIIAVRTAVERVGPPSLQRHYLSGCADAGDYRVTLSEPGLPDVTTDWSYCPSVVVPDPASPTGYRQPEPGYPRALDDLVALVKQVAGSPLPTPNPSPPLQVPAATPASN
jgi:hypothetical protein